MKLSYIIEDIFAKDSELLAAVNDDTRTRASSEDVIVTNKKALGRVTNMTRGEPVYYAFSYINSDETTKLLKSLKGSGPYMIPSKRRVSFIEDTAEHIASQLKKLKLNVSIIATPKSSSALLRDFAVQLAKLLNAQVSLLDKFTKVEAVDIPEDRTSALKYISDNYIDHEYFKQKFKGDAEQGLKDTVLSVYYNIRKNNGKLDAKALFKQYGKFVKGFLKHDLQGDEEYSMLDKEVMIVDDVLSSGSTMSEMFRIAKDDLGAAKVYGVTIFSRANG